MMNAGKYNQKIKIYSTVIDTDLLDFTTIEKTLVLETYAQVKTTKGMTIIKNDSDFEKALTRFTFRYPHFVVIDRDMTVEFNDKSYSIEYINNVDEKNIEIELQCKEVTH